MYAGLLDLSQPLIHSVSGLLSPDECAVLIARIEAQAPTLATINKGTHHAIETGTRNNERAMFDDLGLASALWLRVRPHVPQKLSGLSPVGLNERFRGYRYRPGQYFAPHYDGAYYRDNGERSLLTFMIYLNQAFEGGETAFLELERIIVPQTGDALFFQHPILHEGKAVHSGTKYVLRSDVMYTRAAQ